MDKMRVLKSVGAAVLLILGASLWVYLLSKTPDRIFFGGLAVLLVLGVISIMSMGFYYLVFDPEAAPDEAENEASHE